MATFQPTALWEKCWLFKSFSLLSCLLCVDTTLAHPLSLVLFFKYLNDSLVSVKCCNNKKNNGQLQGLKMSKKAGSFQRKTWNDLHKAWKQIKKKILDPWKQNIRKQVAARDFYTILQHSNF